MKRRIPVLVALMAVVVAACSSGTKAATVNTTTTTSTTSTTIATTTTAAPPAVYPLTGLPVTDPAAAARPALVVKIDNADGGGGNSARPQLGLNQADVVYEEMVEGSVT